MHTVDEIITFLKGVTGADEIELATDLFEDIGVVGDDFDEMMQKFAERYAVNLDQYLWYFHADEEGGLWSIGSVFFAPPYKRVTRIPVSPALLTEAANRGKWEMLYPAHKLPKRRVDLYIDQAIGVLVLVVAIVAVVKKCLS